MDFRLATYNVKCFPWMVTPIKEIVHWITRSCDIVALQEIWCRHHAWATAFAAAGWTFLRPPREHHIISVFGSGLAVAWRTDKWQLRDARQYPYLSAVGIDALVSKGWFRVELTHRPSGAPLRLINTHMQSDYEVCNDIWRTISEPVRMGQAQQLIESERRLSPAPTLITGDMNTEMCWFPDCRWLTRHAGPTFDKGSQVLDHCATWQPDAWTLQSHRVARECGDLSDHWPVLWHLRWRGSKGNKHE